MRMVVARDENGVVFNEDEDGAGMRMAVARYKNGDGAG